MHVTIITSTAYDDESGACGWAAVGQSPRDQVFRVGGRLLQVPESASDGSIMAAVNGIHHAIISGAVGNGDTVIVGMEEIEAVVGLAMNRKGPTGKGTPVSDKAAEVLSGWEKELGLTFEFRHAGAKARFEGMTWQRNACENMARVAAAMEQKPTMQMVA